MREHSRLGQVKRRGRKMQRQQLQDGTSKEWPRANEGCEQEASWEDRLAVPEKQLQAGSQAHRLS